MNKLLTGRSQDIFVPILDNETVHYLQKEAAWAFRSWQDEAKKEGFQLTIASSFRDFERQQWIWSRKFSGLRKVHNDQGDILDLSTMDEWQKCQAILRFSAAPGLSRHHWGTDMDLYDPSLLPEEQKLQLEPFEYQKGGYFFEFSEWLKQSAPRFGFFSPFLNMPERSRVAEEPWHYSFAPLSENLGKAMTADILRESWQGVELLGVETLEKHLDELLHHYFI